MADKIDKALTQEPRKELNIPGQEEIQEACLLYTSDAADE